MVVLDESGEGRCSCYRIFASCTTLRNQGTTDKDPFHIELRTLDAYKGENDKKRLCFLTGPPHCYELTMSLDIAVPSIEL